MAISRQHERASWTACYSREARGESCERSIDTNSSSLIIAQFLLLSATQLATGKGETLCSWKRKMPAQTGQHAQQSNFCSRSHTYKPKPQNAYGCNVRNTRVLYSGATKPTDSFFEKTSKNNAVSLGPGQGLLSPLAVVVPRAVNPATLACRRRAHHHGVGVNSGFLRRCSERTAVTAVFVATREDYRKNQDVYRKGH